MRLTSAVRAVLAGLQQQTGVKLSVRELARHTGRSPAAIRTVLTTLEKATLVRHTLQRDVPDHPPHLVWWITAAGQQVAAGIAPQPATSRQTTGRR